MTACNYRFRFIEYIAVKKECKLWETIEIQIVYPKIYYLCYGMYIFQKQQQQKINNQNRTKTKKKKKKRKTEGKRKDMKQDSNQKPSVPRDLTLPLHH